jgi:hypothetical protein
MDEKLGRNSRAELQKRLEAVNEDDVDFSLWSNA